MFGYLMPYKPEMKIKHYDLYKSVYCGLCKILGKQYGFLSRLTLSYDCTVLTILGLSLNREKVCAKKGRCVCNPLKKCVFCYGDDNGVFKIASAVSVIMTYYKLEDTIVDSKGIKRFGAKFLRKIFSHCHRKAAADFPKIEQLTLSMMNEQLIAEREQAGIDRAAQPSADMIAGVCMCLNNEPSLQPILKEFGYYVGRWIYLMDAADDLEKDKKHHNFNPFLQAEIPNQSINDYCNSVLNASASRAVSAFNLLDLRDDFAAVLENILNDGIAAMQKKCLYGEKDDNEGK